MATEAELRHCLEWALGFIEVEVIEAEHTGQIHSDDLAEWERAWRIFNRDVWEKCPPDHRQRRTRAMRLAEGG
jgi:hypothetical protein